MRILYHHRTLADGAEGVHIREMVSAFRALGHDVRVLGLAAGGGTRSGVAGRLRRSLPAWSYELASAAANAAEYASVRREAAAFRPDFLYKRHARNDVGALSAVRAAGIPSVLEVNCLFTDAEYAAFEPMTFARLSARLERRALALATRVVAVSTPLAAKIARRGVADVAVLPNGANPQTFDPSRWSGEEMKTRLGVAGTVVVGWSGIVREWHGLDLLVSAIAQLNGVSLLIVGDGPGTDSIRDRVRQLGVGDRVRLVGRVPHEQMPEYVAAMDVAVVADEKTGVASPMKLVEFMAMAKPVVAPGSDSIRDVVDDGEGALLFKPGALEEMIHCIDRLARDQRLRMLLGENNRRKVIESRNWLQIARSVVHLVEPRPAASVA